MATYAQIQANRKNSLSSTGPRTDQGKAASARNAVSHGLNSVDPVLLHENRSQFQALLDAYNQEFEPVSPHEEFLVRQMAECRWRLDRAHRIENALFDMTLLEGAEADSPEQRMAAAMLAKPGDALAKLQRYIAGIERSYYRALAELQMYKSSRNEADAAALANNKFIQLVGSYADEQYRLLSAQHISEAPEPSGAECAVHSFPRNRPDNPMTQPSRSELP